MYPKPVLRKSPSPPVWRSTIQHSIRLSCDAGTEHSIAGLEELVRATIWKYFQNENGTIDLDDLGHQEPPEGAGRDESLLRGALHPYAHPSGMIDDDDQDEAQEYAARYTLNLLFRVRQDITFYLDPATATNHQHRQQPDAGDADLHGLLPGRRLLNEGPSESGLPGTASPQLDEKHPCCAPDS